MSTRRDFICKCSCLAGLGLASRIGRFGLVNAMTSAASAPSYRALVCIFLFGGNDGNNVIVPMDTAGYDNYDRIRGGLALSSSSLLPITTKAKTLYSFHAQLKKAQALYYGGHLAVVAHVRAPVP